MTSVHKTIQKKPNKKSPLPSVNIHFQTFPFVTLNNTIGGYRDSDDTSVTEMQKFCVLSSSGVVMCIGLSECFASFFARLQ